MPLLSRRLLPLLLAAATLCAGAFPPRAAATADDPPEALLRRFYAWYVGALTAGGDVLSEKRGELRRYASEAFLRRIDRARKVEGGLEADPFLAAQDYDAGWGKNVAVGNVRVTGETATAEVTLTSKVMEADRLRVGLRREAGAWKIDQVSSR